MTNEEAISTIKIAMAEVWWYYSMKYAEAIDMAIDALEKQIPKEVVIKKIDEGIEMFYCPRCHVRFIRTGMKYCGECGQALDWDYRKYRLNKERDSND